MVNTNQGMALFVMIFVGVIVSVAILTTVSDNIAGQSNLVALTNETTNISDAKLANAQINETTVFTITNNPGTAGRKNVSISGFAIGNASAIATVTTDYIVNLTDGTFTLVNTTFWVSTGVVSEGNTTEVSYSYATSEYVEDSSTRSIISLILIFAIIAIFIFVVVMIFKSESMKNILSRI